MRCCAVPQCVQLLFLRNIELARQSLTTIVKLTERYIMHEGLLLKDYRQFVLLEVVLLEVVWHNAFR